MSNDLIDKPLDQWTLDEFAYQLAARYGPTTVPPCRVCGAELSCQRSGGGEPTVWACDGLEPDPERGPGWHRRKEGRGVADAHYVQSEFTDYRAGGDGRVVEAVRRLKAAVERGDKLDAKIAAAERGAFRGVTEQ